MNRFWGLAVLVLAVSTPVAARGQSLSSGSVAGAVTNRQGSGVAGANLSLTHEATGVSRSVRSGLAGAFAYGVLPPGEYALRAEQFGFQPVLVRGIVVRAGQRVEVPITLTAVSGAVLKADTVTMPGALLAGTRPGSATNLRDALQGAYPEESRELTDLARYTSLAGADLDLQGLPASMSGLRIDGIAAGALQSAALLPGSLRAAAFPLSMFESASLVSSNPDVEWSGFAGGSLDAFTARAGRETGAGAFGQWTTASEGGHGLQGGALLALPLVPDTAALVIGFEATRLPSEGPLAFGNRSDAARQVARDSYGVDTRSPDAASAISGFAQLAWQFTANTQLDTRASFATVSSGAGDLRNGPSLGITPPYDGQSLSLGATLTTRFNDRTFQEVRIGFDQASRRADALDAWGLGGVTHLLGTEERWGPDAGRPGDFSRYQLRASEVVHILAGAHRVKLGLMAAFASSKATPRSSADFYFASLDSFAAKRAFRVRTDLATAASDFNTPQAALFIQDTWTAGPGFDLLAGIRLDAEQLPSDVAKPNEAWFLLSGINNADASATWVRLSPRVGFSWDVEQRHESVLTGSVGLYTGTTDPVLLADWISGDGDLRVTRSYGTVGWPAAGAVSGSAVQTPALTLLSGDFAPPRTLRADVGFSRMLGPSTAVRLTGLYRKTEFLPRFGDLNLPEGPVGTDQFGRPLFGELTRRGELLYAEPGSNRRFAPFDQAITISSDAESTYRGITGSVEHRGEGVVDWFASYTYSRTEDNWIPGSVSATNTPLAPSLGTVNEEWMQGRSDYDIPQRAVVGAEFTFPTLPALRPALFYRYHSGAPFTPGFGMGIDANADGSFSNDPAFVDRTISGTDALLASWSCLGDQLGGFAERNSCRSAGVHSLDARLALRLGAMGRYSGELVLDGLNLLGGRDEYLDTGLYTIDPKGTVKRNPATGQVSVPLVANPDFGKSLGIFQPGRTLRLGFRMSY